MKHSTISITSHRLKENSMLIRALSHSFQVDVIEECGMLLARGFYKAGMKMPPSFWVGDKER